MYGMWVEEQLWAGTSKNCYNPHLNKNVNMLLCTEVSDHISVVGADLVAVLTHAQLKGDTIDVTPAISLDGITLVKQTAGEYYRGVRALMLSLFVAAGREETGATYPQLGPAFFLLEVRGYRCC